LVVSAADTLPGRPSRLLGFEFEMSVSEDVRQALQKFRPDGHSTVISGGQHKSQAISAYWSALLILQGIGTGIDQQHNIG